ncbi:MAG: polysaccharide deacetylase family protein [Symploca sp. SIO3C6]|uniref:Polysaccharide deacetylase family protein n=1 Tax=Symploca sp. SIO1C4 TaxID=2607765 RepID=A0A6B3MXG9_9CYAN|nr:polysaccharide deacetylase family protein [Symploca sp. SIO3C6]NER26126.1 polysaccharide deacetylase family protein [Symploca sp. SIO1C4]NET05229.1 polysaccharide deacetylase family protein [Symploca sp. SIO2B6]NET53478.1 polysaccharide deacetylase family protein [Merismopedia sp. SIO2A8]
MELAPLYPILYRLLKPAFGSCLWAGSNNSPMIALTFDDGPNHKYTPQLLQVLERYSIKASFFWLGACVNQAPAVAREVYQRGHWLGLHGYDHRSFPWLKRDELKQSLLRTQEIIATTCQIHPNKVRDVRPPNGLFTPQTLSLLHQWQYRPVMWSVVPEDWERPGVSVVVRRVLQQVENGSLIVLHDGHCGGQDVAQTAELIIPQLLQQGYRFVTVEQLWQFVSTKD